MAEAAKTIATMLEAGRWINRIDGRKIEGDFQRRVHAEKVAQSVASKDGLTHEIYGNSGEIVRTVKHPKPQRREGPFGWFALGTGGGISSLFH